MRKTPLLSGVLALTCLCLAWPAALARKLTLAATEYPPYYGEALPRGGPVTEITVAALRKAGHEVQVRFLPWARALRLGEEGAVDGLVGVWHSAERDRFFLYSLPVVANRLVLCKRAGSEPARFEGFAALEPYTVGVVRGYADPPGLAAAHIRTEAVVDDLQNLRKLAAGHVDLVLIDSRVGRYLADKHLADFAPRMECLQPAVEETPQYLVVSRHAPDAAKIIEAFNEGMKQLLDSGEFAEIAARWGL